MCIGFFTFVSNAQTKLIAYKSHSGNSVDFTNAVSEDFFDSNVSNFGIIEKHFEFEEKIDSVIFIDDNKSVIVSSRVANKKYASSKNMNSRKDTLHNNPYLNFKNLDNINKNLNDNLINFNQDIDKVIFLKYDADKKTYKNVTPKTKKVKKKKNQESSNSNATLFGFLLISSAVGFLGIRRKK